MEREGFNILWRATPSIALRSIGPGYGQAQELQNTEYHCDPAQIEKLSVEPAQSTVNPLHGDWGLGTVRLALA
jgi:hypothetical protein